MKNVILILASFLISLNCLAFDLRGYKPGMSEDEFKAVFNTNNLDADTKTTVVCSNNRESYGTAFKGNLPFELRSYLDAYPENSVGVCGFYKIKPVLVGSKYMWDEFNLIGFDVATEQGDVTIKPPFLFTQIKPNQPQQLARIWFSFNSNIFGSISEIFAKKYGKPKSASNSTVQNRMGAKFNNVVLTWQDSISSIYLEKYLNDLDTSYAAIYSTQSESALNKLKALKKKEDSQNKGL